MGCPDPQQRDAARAIAHATQGYRRDLKRGIRDGSVDIAEVIRNPHPYVRRMLVIDLLRALPRVHYKTADRILVAAGIAPTKSLIGMTHRQVEALIAVLQHPLRRNQPTHDPFRPDPLAAPIDHWAA